MIALSSPSIWDSFLPTMILVALLAAILPWVSRENPIVRASAMALCMFLSWRYMGWRLTETIPWSGRPIDLIVGLIFVAVEFLSLLSASASMVFLTRIANRSAEADAKVPQLLAKKRLPLVDILICTYNEEREILERTIIGAMAGEYPNQRVWVCDDKRRPWLKDLCQEFGVGYLTRPDNSHAKAGNINAALKNLGAMAERPDFVCILDADFVATPKLILRALSLMDSEDVGVVQTPQHFFNSDPVQHNLGIASVWPDEQRFFFDVVMASKDAWGAAFCCGTSSLIRFSALEAIGGFPTDSVTEDYLLSLRLRQKGMRTIYLNEKLSLGLAPEGLAEYCIQRSRWCLGFVQICRGPSGPHKFGNNLPWVDRIMLTETFLNWSATHLLRILCIVVPGLYLLFGIEAVYARVSDAISYAAPFVIAQMAVMAWLTRWRLLPVMTELYQLIPAFDLLKAVWAGLTRPQGQKFKVTAKGVNRDGRVVQWPLLRVFLFLLAMTFLGIIRTFLWDPAHPPTEADAIALFWSWYNICLLTIACFACIEMGQRRKGDRFAADEPMSVEFAGEPHMFRLADISITGARFISAIKPPPHATVRLQLGARSIQAHVARATPDGFAVVFATDIPTRIAAVSHVYSGRYSSQDFEISPRAVARAVLGRVFY